ncbi:MAG TPA: DNA adenine methylase [Pyrinomonadaceae bacterium]|jgi:DNA adenine methylase|nr:DNA adenine methylase [Pyrinomonadaceae bacterium]
MSVTESQQALFEVAPERRVKPHPFLKWAGGKRQLLDELKANLPVTFNRYFEPFLGAGALLFELQPYNARISDLNGELINCYQVIKDDPQGLLAEISKHEHTEAHFYEVRNLDRLLDFKSLPPAVRAARTIYLNKTCFNGLYRVNSKGHFNVPFGKYLNPVILDEGLLVSLHSFLNTHEISIYNEDFQVACSFAGAGDFIYFDPPYDPVSSSSSFTGYNFKFGRGEQERLKDTFVELDKRGCKVLLSNSATDFVKELYAGYHIMEVQASRAINSVATKRGKVSEFLVRNY